MIRGFPIIILFRILHKILSLLDFIILISAGKRFFAAGTSSYYKQSANRRNPYQHSETSVCICPFSHKDSPIIFNTFYQAAYYPHAPICYYKGEMHQNCIIFVSELHHFTFLSYLFHDFTVLYCIYIH